MTESETAAFEHPTPLFPAEHYLIVREIATLAYEEHPPCQSYPELWWGKGSGSSVERAVVICKTRCSMMAQCLAYALEAEEEEGVWGGTTPAERKRMKKLQTDNRQDTPLESPPSRPGTGGPDIPPPPAGQSEHRIQKGTPRHHRARGGEQAPQPSAAHRPQRTRESV